MPYGISLTIFRHHSHRRGALSFIQMWNKNCVILFMHILRICDSSTCCKWVNNTHWENYDEFLSMAMQTRQYAPFSCIWHVWNFHKEYWSVVCLPTKCMKRLNYDECTFCCSSSLLLSFKRSRKIFHRMQQQQKKVLLRNSLLFESSSSRYASRASLYGNSCGNKCIFSHVNNNCVRYCRWHNKIIFYYNNHIYIFNLFISPPWMIISILKTWILKFRCLIKTIMNALWCDFL